MACRPDRSVGAAGLGAEAPQPPCGLNGLHARTDGFTSLAVVGAAAGAIAGWKVADPIIGLAISVAILNVLRRAARDIYWRLMDRVDPDLVERIEQQLSSVPGVAGVDRVRVRWIGHELHADADIALGDILSVTAAHEVLEDARHHLLHTIPRLVTCCCTPTPRATPTPTTAPPTTRTDTRDNPHAAGGHQAPSDSTSMRKPDSGTATQIGPGDRSVLLRRGLRLEYATLGWNVVEIGFLVAAAISARSVALAGFALDSLIEIFASIIVVWQLKGTADAHEEQRAVHRIGVAFFLLAVYIAVQAVVTVALDIQPDASPLGIAWLAATCVVMLALAAGKATTGARLDNPVLRAEAKVTLVDGALAAGILTGLVLNAAAGWWWADIAAGVILIGYGTREGLHHLRQ